MQVQATLIENDMEKQITWRIDWKVGFYRDLRKLNAAAAMGKTYEL